MKSLHNQKVETHVSYHEHLSDQWLTDKTIRNGDMTVSYLKPTYGEAIQGLLYVAQTLMVSGSRELGPGHVNKELGAYSSVTRLRLWKLSINGD